MSTRTRYLDDKVDRDLVAWIRQAGLDLSRGLVVIDDGEVRYVSTRHRYAAVETSDVTVIDDDVEPVDEQRYELVDDDNIEPISEEYVGAEMLKRSELPRRWLA